MVLFSCCFPRLSRASDGFLHVRQCLKTPCGTQPRVRSSSAVDILEASANPTLKSAINPEPALALLFSYHDGRTTSLLRSVQSPCGFKSRDDPEIYFVYTHRNLPGKLSRKEQSAVILPERSLPVNLESTPHTWKQMGRFSPGSLSAAPFVKVRIDTGVEIMKFITR